MKNLIIPILVLLVSAIAPSYAQLPGNPANPHGTVLNDPGIVKFDWELQGDSLYYRYEITTPSVFVSSVGLPYNANYLEFWAYNHNDDPWFPGSMSIEFDAVSFPYGNRVYYGVMDVSGYDPDWTSFNVTFGYLSGSEQDPVENSYSELFNPFD